jgi:predicted AAA+ superfamily ATPase
VRASTSIAAAALQGRYHHLRLYPLSLKEAGCRLDDLMTLGPFPEPLLKGSAVAARRWSRQYRSRLVREDVAALERIADLGALEQLTVRLPDLVGAPLSLNALREDLQVAHKTVERWMDALERLLFVFRLSPFGPPRVKALKKSRKHYLFDWTSIPDIGPRFENLVAYHLLKECHYLEDVEGDDMDLRVFRDIEGREVDLVQQTVDEPLRSKRSGSRCRRFRASFIRYRFSPGMRSKRGSSAQSASPQRRARAAMRQSAGGTVTPLHRSLAERRAASAKSSGRSASDS